MGKAVLITGASSGIGRATVQLFAERGWGVAATMRNPGADTELGQLENVRVFRLDVTDPGSIEEAVAAAVAAFGEINVLVNNAGYGAFGPVETADMGEVRAQFETNLFGLMAVTRALIPHFSQRGGGCVVNISSMGGRVGFPFYALYHASKWAVEGLTESWQYELEPLGVTMKLVEPGMVRTDFYGRSRREVGVGDGEPGVYAQRLKRVRSRYGWMSRRGIPPERVAAEIYGAATDYRRRLRYLVGLDARLLVGLRFFLPTGLFYRLVRRLSRAG